MKERRIKADIEICKKCPQCYSFHLNEMKINTVFFCEKKDGRLAIGSEMTSRKEGYLDNNKFYIPADCDYKLEQLMHNTAKAKR